MKRRRLFEPCGADTAGDDRGASSTSRSVPDAPWEALPHSGNVYIKAEIALSFLIIYDMSHGACRGLDLQYSEQGYMALIVLSLVVVNLQLCLEQEPGMRHEQLIDIVNYVFQVFSARNCVLLQARVSGILNEINSALDLLPGKDMDEAALSYLKERATQCNGDKIKLCQFMGWWTGEEANKAENMVHSHTGEAVNLPCSDDIDDTNSIQNNVAEVESVMRIRDTASYLVSWHFKAVVGSLTHKAFNWSSPDFMSYFQQGFVKMRIAQTLISGTPIKKLEYKEFLSTSAAARRKRSRRCVSSRC
jgi:hypothetical protein